MTGSNLLKVENYQKIYLLQLTRFIITTGKAGVNFQEQNIYIKKILKITMNVKNMHNR